MDLFDSVTRRKNINQLRDVVDLYRELVWHKEYAAAAERSTTSSRNGVAPRNSARIFRSRFPGPEDLPFVILADLNIVAGSASYNTLLESFPECGDVDCGGELSHDPGTNDLIQRFEPWLDTRCKLDYILFSKDHFAVKEARIHSDFRFGGGGRQVGGGRGSGERSSSAGAKGADAAGDWGRMASCLRAEDQSGGGGRGASAGAAGGGKHMSDHFMLSARLEFTIF